MLFLLATLISGKAILPGPQQRHLSDGPRGLLTITYMTGLVFRPATQHARLGFDSIAVLLIYVLAIAGLAALPT